MKIDRDELYGLGLDELVDEICELKQQLQTYKDKEERKKNMEKITLENMNKKELEYIIYNFINYFFEDDWESREQLYENLEYLGIPSGTILSYKDIYNKLQNYSGDYIYEKVEE